MTYTEQDVERVAEAIWREDYFWNTGVSPDHEDEYHTPITWERESKTTHRWGRSVARAALEAMEREQLEDVLDAMSVEYVALSRRQWDEAPRWDADIDDTSRTIGKGKGDTVDEAIRNAVAAAKGEKA